MIYHTSILKSIRAAGRRAFLDKKYITLNVNYPMTREAFLSCGLPPHPQYLTNKTFSHETPAP